MIVTCTHPNFNQKNNNMHVMNFQHAIVQLLFQLNDSDELL